MPKVRRNDEDTGTDPWRQCRDARVKRGRFATDPSKRVEKGVFSTLEPDCPRIVSGRLIAPALPIEPMDPIES